MSQTDKGHWREPPKDRVDPDYPVHLTKRFGAMELDGKTIIYDEEGTDTSWIHGVGIEREAMV